jgi:hypothetical protein
MRWLWNGTLLTLADVSSHDNVDCGLSDVCMLPRNSTKSLGDRCLGWWAFSPHIAIRVRFASLLPRSDDICSGHSGDCFPSYIKIKYYRAKSQTSIQCELEVLQRKISTMKIIVRVWNIAHVAALRSLWLRLILLATFPPGLPFGRSDDTKNKCSASSWPSSSAVLGAAGIWHTLRAPKDLSVAEGRAQKISLWMGRRKETHIYPWPSSDLSWIGCYCICWMG